MKYFIAIFLSLIIWHHSDNIIEAHIPFIANENHVNKDSALEISDISVSKVIYQRLTPTNSNSWIKFNSSEDTVLHMQIGIPKIPYLEDYRPNVEIFENTISDKTLIMSAEYKNPPKEFHEPFTNTYSWILYDEKIALKKNQIYYILSYEKVEKSGKLWIGIGYKEEFSVSDWITLPASINDIQKFHKEENTNTELTPKSKSSDYSNRYIFLSICVLFASVAILIIYLRRKSKIQKGYKKD